VKLLLTLAWFLVTGGLASAGMGRAVEAWPAGATRAISATEHRVDAARPGERTAADWRSAGHRPPAGHAPGIEDAVPAGGLSAITTRLRARTPHFPATAARVERPRRMRFPTEATAPPHARS
jgi:hypothetical protein